MSMCFGHNLQKFQTRASVSNELFFLVSFLFTQVKKEKFLSGFPINLLIVWPTQSIFITISDQLKKIDEI